MAGGRRALHAWLQRRRQGWRPRRAGLRRRRQRKPHPRPGESAGRGADGTHLREPGGSRRQARPGRRRQGHPRDLRPHGDERRGNRRPDRGRPQLRQDPWRRPGRQRRRRTRGRRPRGAGLRLAQPVRHGQGRRHDHQRPRSHLDEDPGAMEPRLFRALVRIRVGTVGESRRRQAVGGQGRRRDHPARLRRIEEAGADDADHRPVAAHGSGLRKDLAPLPRESRPVRRCLRTRLVQAHAPRHGSARALPRPGSAGRRADLAGPGPRRRPRPRRCPGHQGPEGQDPRRRPHRVAAGVHRVGVGVHLPRRRQARRRQRRAHPPRAAEGLGGEPAGATGQGAARGSRAPT